MSGLGAVSAVQSGERAEEQLEHLVVLDEAVVESQEAAETAQWLGIVAALLAILTYVATVRPGFLQKRLGWLKTAMVVVTAVVLIAVLRTAQTGGRISHPEVRDGIGQSPVGSLEEGVEEHNDR